ncbi:MAG TPA: glycosyltransferase [Candidatus Brocadiia bacterium]|nr:glycosyltransferase [Candidatus Brocadiia bacterium]
MTFLFAIDNLRHGGAQKVLCAIIARLDRRKVTPILWRLGGGSDIEKWFTDLGVEIIGYPPWQMWSGLGPARMFARLLRQRPALIQTFLFHADVAGRVMGRLAGAPVVLSSARATNVDKARWQLWLDRLTAPLADQIIAVSSATRDFAVAHEGARPDRTVVIRNGIDVEAWTPGAGRAETRAELGFTGADFVVGTIGRMTRQKGHGVMLEAARLVAARDPHVKWFIAGYGPLEAELRAQIAKAGLGGVVHMLGYRKDVARLLAAMDLFALPSLWEGMPNALLEAMAMGLPAAATAVDGNLELVENGVTGLLTPPSDASAMAQAVERLAADRRLAQDMGRQARARVEREFRLSQTVEAYIALYERLLTEKLGRPVQGLAERTTTHG